MAGCLLLDAGFWMRGNEWDADLAQMKSDFACSASVESVEIIYWVVSRNEVATCAGHYRFRFFEMG